MARHIKHKKSSVPNKPPQVEDIQSGELAVNVADGGLYGKKVSDGLETIIEYNGSEKPQSLKIETATPSAVPSTHNYLYPKTDGLYLKTQTREAKLADVDDLNNYALTTHNHDTLYELKFSKNTAFNKDFGNITGTIAEGDHTHAGIIDNNYYASKIWTGGICLPFHALNGTIYGTWLFHIYIGCRDTVTSCNVQEIRGVICIERDSPNPPIITFKGNSIFFSKQLKFFVYDEKYYLWVEGSVVGSDVIYAKVEFQSTYNSTTNCIWQEIPQLETIPSTATSITNIAKADVGGTSSDMATQTWVNNNFDKYDFFTINGNGQTFNINSKETLRMTSSAPIYITTDVRNKALMFSLDYYYFGQFAYPFFNQILNTAKSVNTINPVLIDFTVAPPILCKKFKLKVTFSMNASPSSSPTYRLYYTSTQYITLSDSNLNYGGMHEIDLLITTEFIIVTLRSPSRNVIQYLSRSVSSIENQYIKLQSITNTAISYTVNKSLLEYE